MPFRDLAQRRFQPYALLPVLVTATAFILSFLCVYAGHTPGMMEEYAVFTLNTSRIGENLLWDLDNKIMSMNLSNTFGEIDLFKRAEPAALPVAATPITAAPTTLITAAPQPRDIGTFLDGISSDAGEIYSDIGSQATSVQSAIESKASALSSAAASKANSAFSAAATSIVETVNEAFYNIVSELELKDFYSIHMMTTCEGEYRFPNGTYLNMTDSDGTNLTTVADQNPTPLPTNVTNSLEKKVLTCESHSFIDPVQIVRILYWIGIIFTGIALLLGIWGTISFSKKSALLNVLGTLPALLLIGLASAAVHGVAVGAAELVNFIGQDVGIEGAAGRKFIALTWATTILLLVNACLWTVLLFVGEKLPFARKKEIVLGKEEM